MAKVYGYARVSTAKQNIERQVRNIKSAYPAAIMLQDFFTGTKVDGRKEWRRLYKRLETGDTVVFDSVSRMSRNAEEGFELYEELYQKGVTLVFLKEHHIDTATYRKALENSVRLTGTAVDHILNGVNAYLMELAKEQIRLAFEQSEKEVMDLRQRTKEGLVTAALKGKKLGRAKGSTYVTTKEIISREQIVKYSRSFDGTLSDEECMKLIGIAPATYYKYKRKLKQQFENRND